MPENSGLVEMKADRGVETGLSCYRLHSGDICDFYETRENISARFIAQIQSSFFSTTFPVSFKCRPTLIVFTVSLTGNQPLLFVCSKYSSIKLDFGILNRANQLQPGCCPGRIVWEINVILIFGRYNKVLYMNEAQLVKLLDARRESLSVFDGNGSHAINLFIDCL